MSVSVYRRVERERQTDWEGMKGDMGEWNEERHRGNGMKRSIWWNGNGTQFVRGIRHRS